MFYYQLRIMLRYVFHCRLTFWSRHSTKVRKDINCINHSEKEKENDAKNEESSQKSKLELAVEAAGFLYESKKLKT